MKAKKWQKEKSNQIKREKKHGSKEVGEWELTSAT